MPANAPFDKPVEPILGDVEAVGDGDALELEFEVAADLANVILVAA